MTVDSLTNMSIVTEAQFWAKRFWLINFITNVTVTKKFKTYGRDLISLK